MSENLHKIRLLMLVRVVAVTALLMAAFVVELWFLPSRSLKPLYILTAATYVLTIIYGSLYTALRNRPIFVYLQLVGDVLTTSGFVYITGGVSSPFTFLYVPVIIAGGMVLYRRGAYVVASTSCLAYGLMVLLLVYGQIAAYPPESFQPSPAALNRASFSLLVHFLGFALVAVLASTLSESLRRTGEELGVARDDLEDLQAFNSLIIDSVNSGLVTTDAAGRITFLNRAAREITGLSERVVRDRQMHQVFGLGPTFTSELRLALASERRHRFEVKFHMGGEITRILGFTASVLRDKNDHALGFIFTFQDLTEIKALEDEVIARERMTAVGEMAAGMAHELRNPLASLSGSTQVLRSAIPDERREHRELLEIIRRESLRLDQVLTDFLAFARPRPFEPESTDLVALVQELVRLLENSPERHPDHRVVTRVDAETLPCRLDVNRMKQVFWNLARNALRAMPEGGQLTITVGPGAGATVVLAFEDTGRGMSPGELQDFFRPFRSHFQGGTGLGAAIVYRIIEEHHGRVNVESDPGNGTRVTITVPEDLPGTGPRTGEEIAEGTWQPATKRAS